MLRCSSQSDVVIPAGELLSVRIGDETFQIPFEHQPYVGEMVSEELYKQKLSGIGTQAVPANARNVTFRLVDKKTGEQEALSVTIFELNYPLITIMQQDSMFDFSRFLSLEVLGPRAGLDNRNSIYRTYHFTAEFRLIDGQKQSIPFRCQGPDGFGSDPDKAIFGCYISFPISDKLALLMRVDPGADPSKLRDLIRLGMITTASMQDRKDVNR
jgi:hypothetical protein